MTKPEFINKMAEKNLFWSYDLKSGSELPDEVVIEINYYLGIFFFQVTDINDYLNQRIRAYPRLERLSSSNSAS